MTTTIDHGIETWPLDKLIPYARNPRKNDAAVSQMVASIREFGFKIPCLVRADGEVVDGHLRLKAARQLGLVEVPVILCDEWTPAQVKAFRLMVNRSVTWADWDEELLALELLDLQTEDFDLSLTGFSAKEIDALTLETNLAEDEIPPVPKVPTSATGDLWLCGPHRVLCGDSTKPEDVARLLGDRKPLLMVTDPPYGIELDSEWRDKAGLNGCGAAEPSYMKHRTEGHESTTISGDTRADWSEAFELVPSIQSAYVWHASKFTPRSPGRPAAHRLPAPPADHLGQGPHGAHTDPLLVPARALLVCAEEECAVVREGRRELHHLAFAIAEIYHGRIG